MGALVAPFLFLEDKTMQFTIIDNRIVDPGKFEQQQRFVPLFYELMLDGAGYVLDWPDGTSTSFVAIYEGDRSLYPELEGFAYVALEETAQGFLIGQPVTEETFEELERQCEREWYEDRDQDAAPCAEDALNSAQRPAVAFPATSKFLPAKLSKTCSSFRGSTYPVPRSTCLISTEGLASLALRLSASKSAIVFPISR
jgi:hypothetical protein